MKEIYSFLEKGKINYNVIKDDSIIIIYDTKTVFDINFIVPVRGRINFADAMYSSFCKAASNVDLKISYTVVEFSHIPEHSKFCKKNKINYIWIKSEENQLFNKCLCLNFGALFSVISKSYLFHDIDCLIQSDFFEKLLKNIKSKSSKAIQCFHGRRVLYLDENLTNSVLKKEIDIDSLKLGNPGISLPYYIGAPGGSIYVERELFFNVGGYDPELFQANAPEDSFFWKKIDAISKMDICDNPQIDIFHMNHRPTYYDNPKIDEMKRIYHAFENSEDGEKILFINKKSDILKEFNTNKMEKVKIKLVDNQFAHGKSFGTGDLQIPPENFDWYRGNENINDLVVFSEDMLSSVDLYKEKHKIGFIIEAPGSNMKPYEYIRQPENYNKFEYILTFNQELINLNPEKFKYYVFGGCWILKEDQKIHEKTKNISIIASIKKTTSGHKLRHEVIDLYRSKIDDLYGGGYKFVQNKIEALRDYRFSIVIEQDNCPDLFSEKLIDCIMTGTVPIYWGCGGNIGKYFNIDGIINFNNASELSSILDKCDENFYISKMDAIKENFETAKKYVIPEDYMWHNYFKQIINQKSI